MKVVLPVALLAAVGSLTAWAAVLLQTPKPPLQIWAIVTACWIVLNKTVATFRQGPVAQRSVAFPLLVVSTLFTVLNMMVAALAIAAVQAGQPPTVTTVSLTMPTLTLAVGTRVLLWLATPWRKQAD